MLYRTLSEAQGEPQPWSWKHKGIVRVTFADGREYFRTYTFDSTLHRCKRCRKARPRSGERVRLASTGHVCKSCGNPFAGFVRQGVRRVGPGKWEVLHHCWSSSGRLH